MTQAAEQAAPSRVGGPPPLATSLRSAVRLALAFAAIKLALQIAINLLAQHIGYGIFRDELYYIVCGRHLALGYVDQGPIVALQARLADTLFGHDRLWAFRLFSELAGAATVFVTGLLAWAFGGGRGAQALAMLGVLAALVYLPLDLFLSMNSFEPVFWMAALLGVLLIARGASPRWWILTGIAGGLAIENKLSAVFFLGALLCALLLTPQRRLLANRYFGIGVALVVALALPNFRWQVAHHFPTLEWLRRIERLHKNTVLGPGDFILQQIAFLNPLSIVLWGGGILWLLFSRTARRFRFIAVLYLIFVPVMWRLHSKDYYLAPIYPVYFAAGGVAWMTWQRRPWQRRVLVPAYAVLLCLTTALLAPAILPVLPPERFAEYEHALHFRLQEDENYRQAPTLPQFLADMTSWPQFTAQVAAAYNALPPALRSRTGIYCDNYGEAGAVDVLGPRYGLPYAISGHQNYWLWGPRGQLTDSMLVVGSSREDVEKAYATVRLLGRIHTRWAMPYENDLPLWYAAGRRYPVSEIWPKAKSWY
jgi:4-amino-4-deoxy-L-arabinose transferase-like glycosyltransferase